MWVAKEWSESQDSSPTREGQQTLQNSSVLNQQQRAGEKSQIRDTNAPIFCEPLEISQRRDQSDRSVSMSLSLHRETKKGQQPEDCWPHSNSRERERSF
ncbi:hypothetical protein RBSH_01361 [Rhodopirellula baltica SH28]|uniref:Uncharacterized protein n=1 Tax=Rhodopirellula baltica SH28 TaxID=993517 RepID=K5DLI8_RHOBT|nr:hypothetical protein RBSH_01361 [Rhodopirellula baltica SH28]